MQQRLALARKVQSAVDTHAKDAQLRRADVTKAGKHTPPVLLPGSFCYYKVQRFTATFS